MPTSTVASTSGMRWTREPAIQTVARGLRSIFIEP